MLRTSGVFVAGPLLGVVPLRSLAWAMTGLLWSGICAYSMAEALTGGAVGVFIPPFVDDADNQT
jgi:hypothetical protein